MWLWLQASRAVEAVASLALKSRLKSYDEVVTLVECDGWSLLNGRVDAAAVLGRRWCSPQMLTAEVIEVGGKICVHSLGSHPPTCHICTMHTEPPLT